MNLDTQAEATNTSKDNSSQHAADHVIKQATDMVDEVLALKKRTDEMTATAIEKLLEQRALIDRDLLALGYALGDVSNSNGTKHARFQQTPDGIKDTVPPKAKGRFKGMVLAAIARVLITEHGNLHGSRIEALAKAGGFKSKSKTFQAYLRLALQRDKSFVNLGGNIWTFKQKTNGAMSVSREDQLYAWLKKHGPATRSEIIEGVEMPEGTVGTYLSIKKDRFENRDGKWYAR